MSEKKGKTILLLLFVFVSFLAFGSKTSARPLSDDENVRLYSTTTGWKDEVLYKSIDVSFNLKIVMHPEAVIKRRKAWDDFSKKRSEETGRPSRIESTGISSPDGSDTRLIEERIRVGNLLNMRSDIILFANKEKTETKSERTSVNAGPGNDIRCYQLDHKSKQVWIWDYRPWPGREVLWFGKVDERMLMDIAGLCNPERAQHTRASKGKDFSYKGTGNIEGHVVEEIECIDPNGNVKYSISLDTQDWGICLKLVRHNKSGLVYKIVEYKQFEKAGGSGELYPRLVTRRYFDEEGKEEKVETINITNVVIGLTIPEDVFKLDVPPDYTIIGTRVKE